MEKTLSVDIKKIVYASLFTALMIVGSYLAVPVPISPAPIVLTNFFIMLSALLSEKWWACGSVGLYLFLGALGFPVFANGSGGIAHLIGPTGGYLVGYLFCAFGVSMIVKLGKPFWIKDVIAMIIGLAFLYVPGVAYLKMKTGLSWNKAVAVGVIPFLIGDVIKIAAAAGLAPVLRPFFKGANPNPQLMNENK
jgi:biotin transport system substrate-specific component